MADAAMLSKAAVEGKLATRADASKHGGDLRKIGQRVHDTLDAVIGPLKVAAEHMDRIAHAGGDATGAEIQRALIAAVQRAPEIEVIEHALAVDLLLDVEGAVRGVTLHVMGEGLHAGVGAVRCRAVGVAGAGRPDTHNSRQARRGDRPTGSRPGAGSRWGLPRPQIPASASR